MSSALGVRDANEASWTQFVDIASFMAEATEIPILYDGDTGYGNFNNVRRLIRHLIQRQISGVVLEDKQFPKLNSFVGNSHPLADVNEFCGKLKAAVDSRSNDHFQVIARTEALIADRPICEAIERAGEYADAGADAIFIHSRRRTADQIIEFCTRWQNRTPVVVCPTTYFDTPFRKYREVGVNLCICANHNLRASAKAMMGASASIMATSGLTEIEPGIASLDELFELLGYKELSVAEKKYLPTL